MTAPAIILSNLRFAWRNGERPVLDIASLQIARGESLFIQGPSGSGKTTLLGMLGGVLVPQQGVVNILDTDLHRLSQAARDAFRAAHIGFIFQLFNLVPYLTVEENVLLPCRFSTARRQRALQRGGLGDEARRLLTSLGLEPPLHRRRATALSVGQQQRVAAARALMGSPEILIADEPTSALDADTRAAFIELLFNECRQSATTLLFVSHDQSLAPLFQRTTDMASLNAA